MLRKRTTRDHRKLEMLQWAEDTGIAIQEGCTDSLETVEGNQIYSTEVYIVLEWSTREIGLNGKEIVRQSNVKRRKCGLAGIHSVQVRDEKNSEREEKERVPSMYRCFTRKR